MSKDTEHRKKKPVILTGISTSKDVNVCLLGELNQGFVNESKRIYWMLDWYWKGDTR